MKVRLAPSPTGSLQIGNALGAVANRNAGDAILLRIDDTDAARNPPGGEEAILADLRWLGIEWDGGPLRESERGARDRGAADGLPQRFQGVSLLPAERERRQRFGELRGGGTNGLDAEAAKSIVRVLKAVGGQLRVVRQALSGRESGPELCAVITALPRDERLRRVDAAL